MKKIAQEGFSIKKMGQDLYIEGWANRSTIDRGKDLIVHGAWNLENYKKVPMLLFNHDTNKPIGKTIDIQPNEGGLWVKAKISNSSDPEIKRIRDLIQEGILNAFSVGFNALDEQQDGEGINNIKAAELYEVSVVTLPMNQDSVFTMSAKALASLPRNEAISSVLRQKGAWAAKVVHDRITEIEQKEGTKRNQIIKALAVTSGTNTEAIHTFLAGNTEIESSIAQACARILGLDADKLISIKTETNPKGSTMREDMKPEKKEMAEILSIFVPKEAAESMDAAKQMIEAAGYDASKVEETGDGYVAYQADPAMFDEASLLDYPIGDGIIAVVGKRKQEPMPGAAEEKACGDEVKEMDQGLKDQVAQFEAEMQQTESDTAGNPAAWVADEALWEKAKKASEAAFGEIKYPFVVWWYLQQGGGKKSLETKEAIQPGSHGQPQVDGNPFYEQAKQTNVLLAAVIQELRGLGEKFDRMQMAHEQEMVQEQQDAEMAAQSDEMSKAILTNMKTYLVSLEDKIKKLGA